jgi:NADH-quinone oxidoreductase subunit F
MKTQTVLVSVDSSSILKGARFYKEEFEELIKQYNLDSMVEILETGSLGIYKEGVLVSIFPDGVYYEVRSGEDVATIVAEHLLKGRIVSRLLLDEELIRKNLPKKEIHAEEKRIVLRNVGIIDPLVIEEYIARDGYIALGKVLQGMKPTEVINILKESSLRGRGGAGFPTGRKWEFTAKASSDVKYIVCNADEGEPGTFKDRLIMEGDPHSVIEAMAIAGYTVGADKGYIYIRGEYYGSIDNLSKAIKDAYEWGFLGKNILGSSFNFDLTIRLGAGAYICGEETALIESIEGKPGRPRFKPPYPPVAGLYQKPTVVNNVETFANIPWILLNGAKAFKDIGTATSAGTKVFTLVGNVRNRGLVEVPMGTTVYDLVYRYGGGVPGGKTLKTVQTGGTAGTFIRPDQLHVKLDYDSQNEGVSIGSGVILVIDEESCSVELAKVAMEFFEHESCGKCTPCREGTRMAVSILDSISKGKGKEADLEALLNIADTLEETAFCGLGQAAAMPLKTILHNFREEFLSHIKKQPCPVCVYEKPKKKSNVF